MAQKRKVPEDFDSVSNASEAEVANIHGVLATVTCSPMKKGKRAEYFEAKLTDGDRHMRMVGFQNGQQKKLSSFQKKLESVQIQNCEVRKGRQTEDLEIMLRSSSKVELSPNKFVVNKLPEIASCEIKLEGLEGKCVYDKVCVTGKVVRVEEPVKVSGDLQKQDVTIADSTSATKLTLWQGDVGCVKPGECYRFENVVVRSYQGTKYMYLSKPKEGAVIIKVEDVGKVAEDDLPEMCTLSGVEVAGVLSLNSYSACLGCKGKVEPSAGKIGTCCKCKMQQCMDKCKAQLNAKIMVSCGESYQKLNAFGSNVRDIAGIAETEEVTIESLLSARPFTLTHDCGVITSDKRP